ncbi:hypothetical protein Tco_0751011 [Tanacetum coccineum]|uniref:Uncharacterized protein n=1 Tax=Tanacetum coccineum TaxID=301880 RepID=A0ABQ4Z3S6_9ASTR
MLEPSGGGLIIYQAYGNLYAMAGRKAHLLEDKQIPSIGVFDEVSRIWKAFGGNTRDLGSFGEETDKTTDLHQHLLRLWKHDCVERIPSGNSLHTTLLVRCPNGILNRRQVQSLKTRNTNKPVEPKSHTQKSGRQIFTENRFSPNKSSIIHEKINTPKSCLRWKPTGRIFKTVGLRWIPTGKIFTSSTTTIDSEPQNGSIEDITNPYECEQTLNVSTSTLNISAASVQSSSGLVPDPIPQPPYVPPTKNDWDILFQPMFDEFFNPPPTVVSLVPVTAAPRPIDPISSPVSTSIDQDAPSACNPSTQEQEQSPIISVEN